MKVPLADNVLDRLVAEPPGDVRVEKAFLQGGDFGKLVDRFFIVRGAQNGVELA